MRKKIITASALAAALLLAGCTNAASSQEPTPEGTNAELAATPEAQVPTETAGPTVFPSEDYKPTVHPQIEVEKVGSHYVAPFGDTWTGSTGIQYTVKNVRQYTGARSDQEKNLASFELVIKNGQDFPYLPKETHLQEVVKTDEGAGFKSHNTTSVSIKDTQYKQIEEADHSIGPGEEKTYKLLLGYADWENFGIGIREGITKVSFTNMDLCPESEPSCIIDTTA